MVRSAFGDNSVDGRFAKKHLADFLQPGLIILLTELFHLHVRSKESFHKTASGVVSPVLIPGAQQSFERSGKNRRFSSSSAALLAFTEKEQRTQLETIGFFRQHGRIDQPRAHARKVAFTLVRKTVHQNIANGEI